MNIAVDFDGTIVEHKYPHIGKELPFAIETLLKLQSDGHKLILWTSREGVLLEKALNFCKERGLTFYSVNSEYPNAGWSESGVSRKLKADIYIDDHSLGGLPEWSVIYEMISKELKYSDVGYELVHPDPVKETRSRHHRRHHHNKQKKQKKGFFSEIIRRCKESREKFNR